MDVQQESTAAIPPFQRNGSTSLSEEESLRIRVERARVEPLYDSFVCPLTKAIMKDPVSLESGQTYERVAIERWFDECSKNGRPPICPMTGLELETTDLKPSLAIRQTIEEWTARNEAAQLDNARLLLASDSEHERLLALKDLQALCSRSSSNKHKARASGLIPLIVNCLKSDEAVRCHALATLRSIAEDVDSNKDAIAETDALRSCVKCLSRESSQERAEAVSLLHELSKSRALCKRIVALNGAILMLVKTVSSHSDNVAAVQHADETLDNLEAIDESVRPMAENGRLEPLLKRLVQGSEEVRVEMASILAELVLSTEGNARAAEIGGRALVDMVRSGAGNGGREAALRCLCHLSELESNGHVLARAGILWPLVHGLYEAGGGGQLPAKLKEMAATALANVVSSGIELAAEPIDGEGRTLLSEPVLHSLLHLVSNTGPAIGARLLAVLAGLAGAAPAKVAAAVKSAGAAIALIQFLEAPQRELRAASLRLLHRLSGSMGQELADGLRITTGQLGTLVRLATAAGGAGAVSEEQAAAAQLLGSLPAADARLTAALLDESALPAAMAKLDELNRGVLRIGASRFVGLYKDGLAAVVLRFTVPVRDGGDAARRAVEAAQEHGLAPFLVGLLLSAGGGEEVQRASALALANLSARSRALSWAEAEPEDDVANRAGYCCCCLGLLGPGPGPKQKEKKLKQVAGGRCPVHGGRCSARRTFCLVEAGAVPPLVGCLDHGDPRLVEAALGALATLLPPPAETGPGPGPALNESIGFSSRPFLSKSSDVGAIRDDRRVGSILVLSHHRMSTSTINARMLAGSTPPPGKQSYNDPIFPGS